MVPLDTAMMSSYRLSVVTMSLSAVVSVAYLGFGKGGGHGEYAEREPMMEVWGRSPQRGPGAEPLVGGSGGLLCPLKLKHFLLLNVQ